MGEMNTIRSVARELRNRWVERQSSSRRLFLAWSHDHRHVQDPQDFGGRGTDEQAAGRRQPAGTEHQEIAVLPVETFHGLLYRGTVSDVCSVSTSLWACKP